MTATGQSRGPAGRPPGPGAQGRRLHHLALGARDVERVTGFYRELLGLREVARQRRIDGRLRSVWLDLGGALLMIEETQDPPRRVEAVGAGLFLIALSVDPEQRESLAGELSAAGFPIDSRTEQTLYFRDPEGNRVAISSYAWPGKPPGIPF